MSQKILVDMTPGFRQPTVYFSQGDIGTTFNVDLTSRFGDSLPASPTITLQATKPSGLGFSVSATSISGSIVTFTMTETMTNEAGRFPAELKIVNSGVTIYTANFYMQGEKSAHPEGTTDGDLDHILPRYMSVQTITLGAGDSASYSFDPETNTAIFGIPKGADGSLSSDVLAPTYSASATYSVGDYVYYNGALFRCTTAITTAEAWTSAHWAQVALAPEVTDLKSDINAITLPSINLFDVSQVVDGYISSSTGEIVLIPEGQAVTSAANKNYISVEGGETYCFTSGRYVVSSTYDSDHNFIENIAHNTNNVVTYGATVAYVRLSAYANGYFANGFMFVKGDTLPSEYIPYARTLKYDATVERTYNKVSVVDDSSTNAEYVSAYFANEKAKEFNQLANDVAVVHKSINLLDESKVTAGFLYPDGTIDTSGNNATAKHTAIIPVIPNKYLLFSYRPSSSAGARFGKSMKGFVAYDRNMNVISSLGGEIEASTYILIPEDVYFVIVNIRYYTDGVDLMLELSNTTTIDSSVSHYEEYYETYFEPKGEVTDEELAEAVAETKAYASQLVEDAASSIELPSQLGVISYTIEQFEGETLEDKFYNALDTIPKGIITCGNITLTKKYTPISNKNYRGITIADSVLTIGIDGWWNWGSTAYGYCPQFINCVISCVNGNAVFGALGNAILVSPTFNKCYFQSPVILNSATVLMQSLRAIDCEFQTNTEYSYTFCKAYRYWDINFIGNRFESGKGTLFESTYNDTGWAVYHAVFRNNIFEGRSDTLLKLGSASDIQFKENYFEHNLNPWFNITKPIDVFIFSDNYVNEGDPEEDTACFVITERPTTEVIQNNALLLVGTGKVLVRYA